MSNTMNENLYKGSKINPKQIRLYVTTVLSMAAYQYLLM